MKAGSREKICIGQDRPQLLLAMVTAVVFVLINEISFRESTSAAARIELVQQSWGTLNEVVQLVLDAETGQRGYLVYRLAQESLTNIGKYAEATRAIISLQNDASFVSVEVTDNGKGF